MSLSNLFCAIPLILEVSHLGVPVDFVRDSIKGHDPFHKQSENSSSKEANKDIMVYDAGMGGITLEGQDVTFE